MKGSHMPHTQIDTTGMIARPAIEMISIGGDGMASHQKMIGLRIKNIRYDRNETQQQLGEAVGVVQQSVAAWESGRSLPNLLSLIRIAEHYQVSADWILGLPAGSGDAP